MTSQQGINKLCQNMYALRVYVCINGRDQQWIHENHNFLSHWIYKNVQHVYVWTRNWTRNTSGINNDHALNKWTPNSHHLFYRQMILWFPRWFEVNSSVTIIYHSGLDILKAIGRHKGFFITSKVIGEFMLRTQWLTLLFNQARFLYFVISLQWSRLLTWKQILFKAILQDLMEDKKCYFSLFSIINVCNDPCCHRILSPQVYSCWVLCVKWNIVHSMSSHLTPQWKPYRDPGKGKVIADCVITTTPIAFIFTRYCLLLMFYRFM